MSLSFTTILRSEFKKTKNIYGLTISLAGPLIVVLGMAVYYWSRMHEITGPDTYRWKTHARYIFNFFFFLYPLYAALIGFLLTNIEHKNRGFKQLFTLPAPKAYFYLSKILILIFWMVASLLLGGALMVWSGQLFGAMYPETGYALDIPWELFLPFFFKLFIATLCILSIHYVLSIYWDNFIISVGSACFLVVFGMVAYRWEYSHWIPYAHSLKHYLDYMSDNQVFFNREVWISLAYAAVFFVGGYFLMARKEIS